MCMNYIDSFTEQEKEDLSEFEVSNDGLDTDLDYDTELEEF